MISLVCALSLLYYIPLEPKDVKGFVHDLHLLHIVDGLNLDLAEAAGWVVIDVVGQLTRFVQVNDVGDQEVEDVVASLAPLQFISELTSS